MAVAIRFDHVSKSFRLGGSKNLKEMLLGVSGGRDRSKMVWALKDLNTEIHEGESVALLGHNGSGKSTTLKMLAGTIAPTSGQIWAAGRIAPLLELGAGFHPDLTGRENVFLNAAVLGISRREVQSRFDEIVGFAEIDDFLDTPLKFYSSGMAARLGFAVAVNVEPEILLVDEVLAVGDERFQQKCLDRMRMLRGEGRTTVLVTHALQTAQEFCGRAIVLNHGVCVYDGPIAGAEEPYHLSSRMADSQPIPAEPTQAPLP